MGFLERLLRQKIETESLAKQQGEEALMIAKQAEEVDSQRRAQEKAIHKQRQEQAESYYNESGVGNLISSLSEIIQAERCNMFGEGRSLYSGYVMDSFPLPISQEDPDSAIPFFIRWDVAKMGYTKNGDRKFVGKHIVVETCPEGTIIFHSGKNGSSKIPAARWRSNPDILEDSLEKAYNQPGRYVRLEWVRRKDLCGGCG